MWSQGRWNRSGLSSHGQTTFWPFFLLVGVYFVQPAMHILMTHQWQDFVQIKTIVMAESVAMNGCCRPSPLIKRLWLWSSPTPFDDLCCSSQLQMGEKNSSYLVLSVVLLLQMLCGFSSMLLFQPSITSVETTSSDPLKCYCRPAKTVHLQNREWI